MADTAVWKKLDRANHQLTEIRALLVQLIEATHQRSAITSQAMTEPASEDFGAIGWVYELHVPGEPGPGTVVLGRENTVISRKSSGWQVAGGILTTSWVDVLNRYGPVKVIHVVKEDPT